MFKGRILDCTQDEHQVDDTSQDTEKDEQREQTSVGAFDTPICIFDFIKADDFLLCETIDLSDLDLLHEKHAHITLVIIADTFTTPDVLAENRGATDKRGNILAFGELALMFRKILSLDLVCDCLFHGTHTSCRLLLLFSGLFLDSLRRRLL